MKEKEATIDFETAIGLYEEAKEHGIIALRMCYAVATTVHEVLEAWECSSGGDDIEAGFEWNEVCARALELARIPEDAWEVFSRSTYGAPDIASFDKTLELCKSKEQVMNVMDALGQIGGDLALEECYKKLFIRAHELPDCAEDRKEPTMDGYCWPRV